MQIFSKKEAIRIGWELMKKHLGFMVIACGVIMVLMLLQSNIDDIIGDGVISFNIKIISYLLLFLLTIGLIKILLKFYDGAKAELTDLIKNYEQYFDYIICTLLVSFITIGIPIFFINGIAKALQDQSLFGSLIAIGGLVLSSTLSIVWGLKYQFAPYLVIDRNMKPMEAIRKSGKITYGHKMNLFLFWFVSLGVVILGFLCCCIGILPAGIVLSFGVIHIYRKLLTEFEKENKIETGSPISEDGPVCDSIPSLESVAQNPSGQAKAEEPKTPDNLGL